MRQSGAPASFVAQFVGSIADLLGAVYRSLLCGNRSAVEYTPLNVTPQHNAALQYSSKGNGHGNGHGNKSALPDALNPLNSIQEIDVFNASTQAVLSADLTMPNQLQYLIKRDISSGAVSAALRIKATTSQTLFHLKITTLNSTLPILQVNSLGLWDTSSNVVVGTTLP